MASKKVGLPRKSEGVAQGASKREAAESSSIWLTKNKYSSPTITARRVRILREARAIIMASGLQFSVRELAQRASVGTGTIYYLFGSKEELVAHVLADYVNERRAPADAAEFDFGTVGGMINALSIGMEHNMYESVNLTKSVDSLIYADTTTEKIRRIIYDSRSGKFSVLVSALRERGELHPWISPRIAADDLTLHDGAIVHEWCSGNLTYEEFRARRLFFFASFVSSITSGASKKAADKAAKEMAQHLRDLCNPAA